MLPPSLTNSKFKLFQRKSKRFFGMNQSFFLPTNIFFCYSFTNFYLSTRHLDLLTRYLKWKLKKSGNLAFLSSNNYPLTKKPTEVWMGKGKGGIVDWALPVKKGTLPFLFNGKKTPIVKEALLDVLKKLPLNCKIFESKHKYAQACATKLFISKSSTLQRNVLKKKNYIY